MLPDLPEFFKYFKFPAATYITLFEIPTVMRWTVNIFIMGQNWLVLIIITMSTDIRCLPTSPIVLYMSTIKPHTSKTEKYQSTE